MGQIKWRTDSYVAPLKILLKCFQVPTRTHNCKCVYTMKRKSTLIMETHKGDKFGREHGTRFEYSRHFV